MMPIGIHIFTLYRYRSYSSHAPFHTFLRVIFWGGSLCYGSQRFEYTSWAFFRLTMPRKAPETNALPEHGTPLWVLVVEVETISSVSNIEYVFSCFTRMSNDEALFVGISRSTFGNGILYFLYTLGHIFSHKYPIPESLSSFLECAEPEIC